ncbi:hypothetical protein S83_055165, partial [Arachis hypogaea]
KLLEFDSAVNILVNSAGVLDSKYSTIANIAVEDFDHIFRCAYSGSLTSGVGMPIQIVYRGFPVWLKYNTFSPDMVNKMPRTDLVEEIFRLQAALGEQTQVTKFSQEEYERLQN